MDNAQVTQGYDDMAYAKSIVETVEQGCTYEDRCLAVRDLLARHRLERSEPVKEARYTLITLARIWWQRKMNSHCRSVSIKGDGRVDVHWSDNDESGSYTLPVDFVSEVLPTTPPEPVAFQQGVDQWMDVCFGEAIKADRVERCDRFIEEALEFVQSIGYSTERAHALVDYVFNRDIGEVNQEVGGVMVTLAAACNTVGVDMQKAAETELARVWTKVEAIRAKQAAKPTGGALPVATTHPEPVAEIERLREALRHYAKDYDHERDCSQWDGGAIARAALGGAS